MTKGRGSVRGACAPCEGPGTRGTGVAGPWLHPPGRGRHGSHEIPVLSPSLLREFSRVDLWEVTVSAAQMARQSEPLPHLCSHVTLSPDRKGSGNTRAWRPWGEMVGVPSQHLPLWRGSGEESHGPGTREDDPTRALQSERKEETQVGLREEARRCKTGRHQRPRTNSSGEMESSRRGGRKHPGPAVSDVCSPPRLRQTPSFSLGWLLMPTKFSFW